MAIIGASNSLGGIAGSNAVARLLIVISGQSTGLEAAVAQSEGTLSGLSKNASSIGKTLTRSLSLPLLALGALAVKAASDFETSFARVIGISTILDKRFNDLNLTSDGLKQTLLDMANDPSIVASPKDLADALYFAGSAGLKASQALDVVKSAAQGASVGLGTAADISKVLIFSLTNFADEGITATKAMDIFTAAVQEGTAAPEELAIALGRVLPVAKAAGVSLQTTVAAVASLTNIGVPTRVATTSLRALFSELLAPTQAATKRLQELGLSADQLRSSLASGGLIATMELLLKATHGNQDALHDIIPQIRGFTAFLGLSNDQAKRYSSALNAVQNSTGKFQKVLEVIQRTPGFQFQKALQQLQVAAISLGETLIPVFVQIAKVLTSVGKIAANMPGPVKAAAAAFIVLGAASGPVLQLFGALTQTSEKTLALGASGKTLIPTWKAVSTGFLTAGLAAAVAIGGFESLAKGSTSLISIATTLIGSFVALQLAIKGLQILVNVIPLTNNLTVAFASLSTGGIALVAASLAAVITLIAVFVGKSNSFKKAVQETGDALTTAANAGDTLHTALENITNSNIRDELLKIADSLHLLDQPTGLALPKLETGAGSNLISTLGQLRTSLDSVGESSLASSEDLLKMIDSLTAAAADGKLTREEFDALTGGGQDLAKALENVGAVSISTGVQDLTRDATSLAEAFPAAQDAIDNFNTSQRDNIIATQASESAINDFAKQTGTSADFIAQQSQRFGVSLVGASKETKDAFLGAIEGPKQLSAATVEAQGIIAKAADDMSSSLTGAFSAFGDLPKTAAPSIDKIITKIQKMGEIATTESQNIVALNKRGVPTSLIEQAIGAGPGFVQRLAGSTDKELKRIVTSYSVALAAMDAEILKEGAHQEIKGNNMVSGFADALLASSKLPQAAATQIITKVTDAFARGDLNGAALGLVTQFVRGLGHVKGLSAKEATAAVNAFADELIAGDVLDKHGKIMADKVVQGILSRTNLSVNAALQLVDSLVGGIIQGEGKAQASGVQLIGAAIHGITQGAGGTDAIGAGLARQFANGITSQTNYVQAAAVSVAVAAKAAMLAASKGSPKFFTYYLGQDLITQMGEGMRNASHAMATVKPKVQMQPGGFTSPGGGGKPNKLAVSLDVKLDRQKAARELSYSASQGY